MVSYTGGMNIKYLSGLLATACLLISHQAVAALATDATAAASAADSALIQLSDEYFDKWYFPTHPSEATQVGIHDFDTRLEDYSRAAIDAHIAALHDYERRFAALPVAALSEHYAANQQLLLSSVRSQLLTLEQIRPWEKNPDLYSSGLASSAFISMARRYAPANERLRRLVEREKLMPAQLVAARANLSNPPPIYTQIAVQQLPDIIAFFRNDVPAAFSDADDAAISSAFAASNAAVIAALESYQQWITTDLLPRSHGDYRLGAAVFRRKLQLDEMVDTPLPELLQIGLANLHLNQREFARVAHQLEPGKSPRQVLEQLTGNHPAPAKLLQSVRDQFEGLRHFLDSHAIITIPPAAPPTVEETPPFMRATTSASMDTPGPFETVATEAYFNVTLPDPSWDQATTDNFMTQWNYPLISNVAVHEAYPGHYIQFLWMHNVPDRVRKLVGASSNAEGWAHYCEQMMLDEGLGQPGAGAPDQRAALWLKLGQLQDALLRNARYIVAIRMHTGSMSYEQAVNYFINEGYQSRKVGESEAKRGTSDATYLYYTLGKLQILKLRADLQKREGAQFSLKAFHDAFMREGFPPLRIVRRALLHDDSPTL
jgi:uncharacterized protein (DUF885 family)